MLEKRIYSDTGRSAQHADDESQALKTAISDIQFQLDEERVRTHLLEKKMKDIQTQLEDLRIDRAEEDVEDGKKVLENNEKEMPKAEPVRMEPSTTPRSGQVLKNCFSNSNLKFARDSKKSLNELSVVRNSKDNQIANLEDTYNKLKSLFETMQSANSRLMNDYQTLQDRARLSINEDQSLMQPIMVDLGMT